MAAVVSNKLPQPSVLFCAPGQDSAQIGGSLGSQRAATSHLAAVPTRASTRLSPPERFRFDSSEKLAGTGPLYGLSQCQPTILFGVGVKPNPSGWIARVSGREGEELLASDDAAAAAAGGPPSEVVPFVFGEVSDLPVNERVYRPYFVELLASSVKYPVDFDRVFWKVLKQQVTGTDRLRSFLAHFLTNRKVAVGGLTGAKLGRRFKGAFLEEGRSSPVTHHLDGLRKLLTEMKCADVCKNDSAWWVPKLCEKFELARDGNAREARQLGARYPREEPTWHALRSPDAVEITVSTDGPSSPPAALLAALDNEVEAAAVLPAEAATASTSDSPTDAPRNETRSLVAAAQFPRGEALQVGDPSEVVPFVFGEVSDLDNELFFPPLIEELLMSWHAFPGHFEDVFWKILLQQTTGTHQLRRFLCHFLTDREIAVGKATGASLAERLAPRFLEEARCSPVTHQLDHLDDMLYRLPTRTYQAYRNKPGDTSDALTALYLRFKDARKENGFEARAVRNAYPRETPPWRVAEEAQTSGASDVVESSY